MKSDPKLERTVEELKAHAVVPPLQILKTIAVIHQHQCHIQGRGHQFHIINLGRLLGIAYETCNIVNQRAAYYVERAYRAATGGSNTSFRGRTYRYVVQDPDGRNRIVEY